MKIHTMLKIYYDAPGETGGGAGNITPPNTPNNPEGTGGGETLTFADNTPEYLKNYINGYENQDMKKYLAGIVNDPLGKEFLEKNIKNPDEPWGDFAEYKDVDEYQEFIEYSKNAGYSKEFTEMALKEKQIYINSQREKMSPELRALDENINNFISNIADPEEKLLYKGMSENAIGRKILVEKIMKVEGDAGIVGGATTPPGTINVDEWKAAYDEAVIERDAVRKEQLKRQGLATGDPYFKTFFQVK